jgi:hypothetical protein
MIKVIQVYTPVFTYNKKKYSVDSYTLENFAQLDIKIVEYQKKGTTHCFIYNMSNVDINGNLVNAFGGEDINVHYVRCKFVKIVDDDNYIPNISQPNIDIHNL